MITVNEYTNRTLLITESTEEPTNFQIAKGEKQVGNQNPLWESGTLFYFGKRT